MSYSILAIPSFRKELNHLVKKYPSLKNEIEGIFESLKQNQHKAQQLEKVVLKLEFLLHLKEKGNLVVHEL